MGKTGHREAHLEPGIGCRSVRLFRFGALFRKARRRRPRETGLPFQTLRRMPRHHHLQESGRAAGGQVGVAGRPRGARAADVEPWRQNAAGNGPEEIRLDPHHGPGIDRSAGVSAKPAGDAQRLAQNILPAGGRLRRTALPIQGMRRLPHRQDGPGVPAEESDHHADRGRHVEPPAQDEAAPAGAVRRRRCARSWATSGRANTSAAMAMRSAASGCSPPRTAPCATTIRRAARRIWPATRTAIRISLWWRRCGSMARACSTEMDRRKLAWPRFTAQQMSDLIAYLNGL